jgi:tetratricopeptide (TPR) repeat protein
LAKLLFEEGEVGYVLSMLEDLAKVTENTPQETEVLLALGSIYQELGLQKRAGDVYRTVAAKSSEPEVLAQAAMALYATGAWSEGTEVARRVDVERLSESTAFGFLLDYAHAMLRADSKRALELMEQAYDDYPEQRTMHETGRLLETYLALDQFDKALALVDELAGQVQPANLETFRELATLCGDYAMNHQDYATAQAVYRKVIDAGDYETQLLEWAKLQLANALYAEGKTEECGSLLESVAASTSPWAADAQLRLDYIKLQGRLSGETRPVAGAEG